MTRPYENAISDGWLLDLIADALLPIVDMGVNVKRLAEVVAAVLGSEIDKRYVSREDLVTAMSLVDRNVDYRNAAVGRAEAAEARAAVAEQTAGEWESDAIKYRERVASLEAALTALDVAASRSPRSYYKAAVLLPAMATARALLAKET